MMTNNNDENIRVSKLCRNAILTDSQIRDLNAQRFRIISLAIPMTYLEDGVLKVVWIDETNDVNLARINKLIESRVEQIKTFYNLNDNENAQ